jgi:sulfopyruvate decarboxylase subunit beta
MIEAVDVFKAFEPYRDKAIVAATGTAGRHWADISNNEKRDVTLGGAMGQATSAAFGLALGLPDEKIVLFDSEGALLMNLGVLASIAGKKPKNFFHFLMDNECYATTGGQPVPNSSDINYSVLAKSAGYVSTYHFDDLEDFAISVGEILNEQGPVFVSLKIVPEIENLPMGLRPKTRRRSRDETIRDLRSDLGIEVG